MDGTAEDRDKAVDREFDWCKVPATEKMQALVDEIRGILLNYEDHCRPRKRQRRPDDQRRFDRMVSGLVCELVHSALSYHPEWRRISLSNQKLGRRNVGPEFVTESLRTIIEYMVAPEMEWIELEKGGKSPFGRTQSTIRASKWLVARARDRGILYSDIGRDESLTGDPIVLRSEKVKGKAEQLVVPEGEPAATYRSEMLRINKWLAEADITCDRTHLHYLPVDTGERWLERIFNNGSLTQGGRLYGGFWYDLKAEDRLRHVYINREPVVGLDYGQCVVRIAYGRLGLEPPPGDLYEIPIVGVQRYREGIKKVFSSMLFSSAPLQRKPRDTAKQLPKNYSIHELQERVRAHHHRISSLFHVGFGMASQFIESQILIRCLLTLIERGVVALPVHDCIVVPRSAADIGKKVMLDAFREIAGAEGVVQVKSLNSGPTLKTPDEDF